VSKAGYFISILNNKRFHFLLLLSGFLMLGACDNQSALKQKHCHPTKTYYPKHAKGFWIEYFNGFKVIHLRDAYDTTKAIEDYAIYPRGKKQPSDFPNAVAVLTPVQKNICLSTTHVGLLEILGITDSISGVVNGNRVYNKNVLSKIALGAMKVVGSEAGMNNELIFSMQPSVVLAYSFNEGNNSIPKLKSLGMSVMMINDYNEREPLARAEWLKVLATLYNLDDKADSILNAAEAEYIALKVLVATAAKKPTVFCNMPWNDVWYMPSGDSYFSNFITDAGGDFLWRSNTSQRVLNLDYEVVYAKAAKADFLLNPNEANSLKDIKAQGKRFENFEVFKQKKIYNNNLRQTATGGNDFWESGVAQPHLVLKDLISIFHPELIPNHQAVYYKQLQ